MFEEEFTSQAQLLKEKNMPSLLELQNMIMEQLQAGEFIQGMEDHYADDAVNEEPTGTRIEGKANIIANERKILEGVAAFHGCTVRSTGVGEDDGAGNGVTFAEYELNVAMKDGSTFNPKQVQVTRWKNSKAKRITFYYDPAQL